jgi:hypothetical protein
MLSYRHKTSSTCCALSVFRIQIRIRIESASDWLLDPEGLKSAETDRKNETSTQIL